MRYSEITIPKILEGFVVPKTPEPYKIKYKINEYEKISSIKFKNVDFTDGKKIGQITTGVGILKIYTIDDENNPYITFGAIENDDLQNPVFVLIFLKAGPNILIAKNAFAKSDEYMKKGIASEMFHLVNKTLGNKIISDTQLSDSGEALWNSLIKSSKFTAKIFYIPTKEIFDLDAIGKNKTSDGLLIKSPAKDFDTSHFYDDTTKSGQRFFYLLESKFNSNSSTLREGKIIQPYSYFTEDDV